MNRQPYRQFVEQGLLAILTLSLISMLALAVPAVSWAADTSSNQALNISASLIAPEPDAKITVYLRPAVSRNKAGYGISGDPVTVLEQVSDNQSLIWNHIRFDNPPHAEGWVQETFLSLNGTATPQMQNKQPMVGGGFSAEERYLGNRPSQSNPQSPAKRSLQFDQQQFGQQRDSQQFGQQWQSNQRDRPQSYSHQNRN